MLILELGFGFQGLGLGNGFLKKHLADNGSQVVGREWKKKIETTVSTAQAS